MRMESDLSAVLDDLKKLGDALKILRGEIRLKLHQSFVGEQNEHFQKTKNLKTISLMHSFLGN